MGGFTEEGAQGLDFLTKTMLGCGGHAPGAGKKVPVWIEEDYSSSSEHQEASSKALGLFLNPGHLGGVY